MVFQSGIILKYKNVGLQPSFSRQGLLQRRRAMNEGRVGEGVNKILVIYIYILVLLQIDMIFKFIIRL